MVRHGARARAISDARARADGRVTMRKRRQWTPRSDMASEEWVTDAWLRLPLVAVAAHALGAVRRRRERAM